MFRLPSNRREELETCIEEAYEETGVADFERVGRANARIVRSGRVLRGGHVRLELLAHVAQILLNARLPVPKRFVRPRAPDVHAIAAFAVRRVPFPVRERHTRA